MFLIDVELWVIINIYLYILIVVIRCCFLSMC